MRIAEVVRSDMMYTTRNWDREEATRYIIDLQGRFVEFSHFRHFQGQQHVKDVVEIAGSFGCSVGCRHCAAADLPQMKTLTSTEIVGCVDLIGRRHGLSSDSDVLLTYSGIGEASILKSSIPQSAITLQKLFHRATFVLTTVGIRPRFICAVGDLANHINLKYLQVSVFSSSDDQIRALIPLADRLSFGLAGLVSAMATEKRLRYRLNYVVIDGLNTGSNEVDAILSMFAPVRDRSVLRVSRLNETTTSRRNGLKQPTIDSIHAIVSRARDAGWDAYGFYSFSDDQLNCGQLAGSYLRPQGP